MLFCCFTIYIFSNILKLLVHCLSGDDLSDRVSNRDGVGRVIKVADFWLQAADASSLPDTYPKSGVSPAIIPVLFWLGKYEYSWKTPITNYKSEREFIISSFFYHQSPTCTSIAKGSFVVDFDDFNYKARSKYRDNG